MLKVYLLFMKNQYSISDSQRAEKKIQQKISHLCLTGLTDSLNQQELTRQNTNSTFNLNIAELSEHCWKVIRSYISILRVF